MLDRKRIREGDFFGPDERNSRIMLVDDDPGNQLVLMAIMRRAGFRHLVAVETMHDAVEAFNAELPDLAVVDLCLPDGDGLELLEYMKSRIPADDYVPLLVLTGNDTVEARDAALAAGAKDYITKPFESTEVLLRVHNLLETRLMHLELRHQRNLLAERFESRGRELEQARFEILERLARVAEHRDDGAFGHIRRVGELSSVLAAELECAPELVEQIRRAATLHDVGKIAIPDEILLKPGPLSPAEFEIQTRHTLIGADILSGGGFAVLRMAEQIALTHHERWDGRGYPNKLAGQDIPLPGRIVAVADNFDALLYRRPYKPAWPEEKAIAYIENGAGRSFDPAVVQAFLRVVRAGRMQDAMVTTAPTVKLVRLSA